MGADANAKNALMFSIESFDNNDVTKAFIRNGADVNSLYQWNYHYKNPGDRYGYDEREKHSVLSMAIRKHRNPETIKALIEAGADVNYIIRIFNGGYVDNREEKYSYSILNMVLRQKKYDLVDLLLSNNANPTIKRVLHKKYSYYDYILEKRMDTLGEIVYSILSETIWNIESTQMLKRMLEHGVDPNSIDKRAIIRNDTDKTTKLIGYGRFNALIDAILYSNDTEMIKLLLKHGANPRSKYYFEGTDDSEHIIYQTEIPVLGLAVQKQRKDVVKLLIDAGASFDDLVTYNQGSNLKQGSSLYGSLDRFALKELLFGDSVISEMGELIRQYGWKGSKNGWFSTAHICKYSW